LPDASSPYEKGFNRDVRKLGIAVQNVSITEKKRG
jgi:hypothetical protein